VLRPLARGRKRGAKRSGCGKNRGVKAPGASHRKSPGDLRLLVFGASRLRVRRAELHAVRSEGEIDLVGYDGVTLAFVEVRTRTVRDDALPALSELSVTTDKQRVVVRTARRFLSERHVGDRPCRFDVLAIDNRLGMPPEVRLHEDAFSRQMSNYS